jgi:hypothetical protein
MGVSLSLLFIAVGAILTFAVSATVSGASIPTIGIILMVVGAIGLVFSLIFWSSWGGFGGASGGGGTSAPQTTVIKDDRP